MKNRLHFTKTHIILKYILICNLFLIFLPETFSQNYSLFNGTIYTCSGNIHDSGGANGGYGKNEMLTTVICSGNPQYSQLELAFDASDIKAGDNLCIYDGLNTLSPLLTCSSEHNNFPFVVMSTKSNPAGCLTLQFKSDNFLQGSGFDAKITCKPLCQEVAANILSNNVPVSGEYDICPGAAINLTANANFPQNDLGYHQDIANCSVSWYLDNKFVGNGLKYALPIYESGGHIVNMIITDQLGCRSQNIAQNKFKVAPKPAFIETGIQKTICHDEILDINTSLELKPNSNLSIKEKFGKFPSKDIVVDSLPLPDGNGKSYSSYLFVSRFKPNEILDDPSDLQSVCVNLEHSFAKDLQVSLSCPNGQRIILQDQQPSPGSVFLGIPVENDELLPQPIPGTGWDYCWKTNSQNGTWNDYILKNKPSTLPAGYYTPFQSFDNLYGCPLNGLWTISVTDLWKSDNGYIFDWSMDFNPILYPKLDSFTNIIQSASWLSNISILSQNQNQMEFAGIKPGAVTQVWQVKDNNSCTFEYPVEVQVLPDHHPLCKNCKLDLLDIADKTICAGDEVDMDALVKTPLATKADFAQFSSESKRGADEIMYSIPVNTYNYPSTKNVPDALNSVCITAKSDDFYKVGMVLVSPDLKELKLVNPATITSKNIVKTCFVVAPASDIAAGTGTYTGNFKTVDQYSELNDCQPNGTWHLKVKKPIDNEFLLKEANLNFNIINKLHYKWSTSLKLACDTCKSNIIKVDQNTTVSVKVSDDYVCTDSTDFKIIVQNSFPAPKITYNILANGSIEFQWLPIKGADSYEISVNGQSWITSNGTNSHIIPALLDGEKIAFQVRVNSMNKNCQNEVAFIIVSKTECGLLSFAKVFPETCLGSNDGSVEIDAQTKYKPVSFSLNAGAPTNNNVFSNLSSGSYDLFLVDAKSCRDTIHFDISTAIPMNVSAKIKNALCNGSSNGEIAVTIDGGVPPLKYTWNNPNNTSKTLDNLAAGTYQITVTDGKNCSVNQSFVVQEPDLIKIQPEISNPSCNGASNGKIVALVTGGTQSYTYLWSNGIVSDTLNDLAVGTYNITVSDANACTQVDAFQLTEPEPISIKISFGNPSCFGMSDGWLKAIASGGKAPYTFQWNAAASSNTDLASKLKAGDYSVTVTDSNNCSATDTYTIVGPEAINASVQATDELCPGQSNGKALVTVSTGNGPFVYNWTNSINSLKPEIDNLQPGNYALTITNVNACSQVLNFTINKAAPFEANIVAPSINCQNSVDGEAKVLITSGVPPYAYLWNDPTAQNTNPATNLSPGMYDVIITDGRNCSLKLNTEIKVKAPILIASNILTPAKCSDSADGSIEIAFQGGTTPYTIQWSNGLPDNSFKINGLSMGTYTFTITDAANCKFTSDVKINAPAKLEISEKTIDNACKDDAKAQIEAFATGGTTPYAYQWNNGINGALNSKLKAGTYQLIITDANACTVQKSIVVNEPQEKFEIEATQKSFSCFGANQSEAIVEQSSGSGTIKNIQWSNNQNANLIKNLAPGLLSVIVTDSYGCQVSANLQIIELQKLLAEYAVKPTSCFNTKDGEIEISKIQGGAGNGNISDYNITWSLSAFNGKSNVSGLSGGTKIISTIEDAQACKFQDTLQISSPEDIKYLLNSTSPKCNGSNDGAISINNISGGNAPYIIKWNNAIQNTSITSLLSGNYTATITDAKGCETNVKAVLDQPQAILLAKQDIIQPKCVYDIDGSIVVNATGGIAPYQYQWSNGNNTNHISNLKADSYKLQITDTNGCIFEKTFDIIPTNLIHANADVLAAACFGQNTGSASIEVAKAVYPLSFSLNGQDWHLDNFFDKLAGGNYNATVKDADGCTSDVSFEIASSAKFDLSTLPDVIVEFGQELNVLPQVNATGSVTYKWNAVNIGKLACDTCLNMQIVPNQTGVVWFKVSDDQGCNQTAKFLVRIQNDQHVFVPTAFSPNQDGVNDCLSVFGKTGIVVRDFYVFDQWGEMVYFNNLPEMNNETSGWDGTFRGKPMNTGVFVWMLNVTYIDGTKEVLSGETSLLR